MSIGTVEKSLAPCQTMELVASNTVIFASVEAEMARHQGVTKEHIRCDT
jgi:hypothetical protein